MTGPSSRAVRAKAAFESGETEFAAGNYSLALKYYLSATQRNHPIAHCRLVNRYEADNSPGRTGINKEVEQGVEPVTLSEWAMGYCFHKGYCSNSHSIGFEKNLEQAKELYVKAAADGQSTSQAPLAEFYLAMMMMEDLGESPETAFQTLLAIAQTKKLAIAQFHVGHAYEYGIGVEETPAEAFKWYKMAAEQGHLDAMNNLGTFYELGNVVEQDAKKAATLYHEAVSQGLLGVSNINLASCYMSGSGIEENHAEAVRLYSLAAEYGDAVGQCILAHCHHLGFHVEKNPKLALEYTKSAVEQEDAEAMVLLGYFYEHGLAGLPVDPILACQYYQKAATSESGEPAGQTYLANVMAKTESGPARKVFKLYVKATRCNYAPACVKMAECLETGYGCSQDISKAIEYYKQAISLQKNKETVPDPLPFLKLARFYEEGYHVPQDLVMAEEYKRQASHLRGRILVPYHTGLPLIAYESMLEPVQMQSLDGVAIQNPINAPKSNDADGDGAVNGFTESGPSKASEHEDNVTLNDEVSIEVESPNRAASRSSLGPIQNNPPPVTPVLQLPKVNDSSKRKSDAQSPEEPPSKLPKNSAEPPTTSKSSQPTLYKTESQSPTIKADTSGDPALAPVTSYTSATGEFSFDVPPSKAKKQFLKKKTFLVYQASESPACQYLLGECYETGQCVAKDMAKAVEFYLLSAQGGDSDALYRIALCYLDGTHVERSIEKAMESLEQIDDEEEEIYEEAMELLLKLMLYQSSSGLPVNMATLEKIAELGNPQVQFELAKTYYAGSQALARDYEKAIKYYRLAADQGHIVAQFNLALIYQFSSTYNDFNQSSQLFQKAASSGNTEAMFYYAYNLYNGLGVPKNTDSAVEYYKKCAEMGHFGACRDLTMLHLQGIIELEDDVFEKIQEFLLHTKT